MLSSVSLTNLALRIPGLYTHSIPALSLLSETQPNCWSRGYATQGNSEQTGGKRQFRRPMRYGSKLAIRDPVRFQRMRSILGVPDEASVPKVESVTINLLQTMKYLMNNEKNTEHLKDILSYKITSLNRQLMPLLDSTQALLDSMPGAAASAKGSSGAGAGGKGANESSK